MQHVFMMCNEIVLEHCYVYRNIYYFLFSDVVIAIVSLMIYTYGLNFVVIFHLRFHFCIFC